MDVIPDQGACSAAAKNKVPGHHAKASPGLNTVHSPHKWRRFEPRRDGYFWVYPANFRTLKLSGVVAITQIQGVYFQLTSPASSSF